MSLFTRLGLFFFSSRACSPFLPGPTHERATCLDPSPAPRHPAPPASTVPGRVSTTGPLLHVALSRTGPPLPSSLRHTLLDPTSLSHFVSSWPAEKPLERLLSPLLLHTILSKLKRTGVALPILVCLVSVLDHRSTAPPTHQHWGRHRHHYPHSSEPPLNSLWHQSSD
jgi:hypothetical protein